MNARLFPLLAALTAAPLFAADEAAIPLLTVSGQGSAQAAPDQATVVFAALAREREAGRAQGRVNKVMGDAAAAVKALGIKPEALSTRGITLQPLYSDPETVESGPREPRITGYEAGNALEVRLDDPARLGPVIDAAVRAGINQIEGVSFGVRDDRALRRAALAAAARDARDIAETLARGMGVRLVSVQEVSEQVGLAQPVFRGMAKAMMAEAVTPVETGRLNVEASVTVRYRIAPQ